MAKRRIRRSQEEVTAAAMELAAAGPFTPQDLAAHVGFTPNRARQLLEDLKKDGKLEVLGQRKSSRGKPAKLWGKPGTEVTEADKAPRPKAKKPAPAAAPAPAETAAEAPRPQVPLPQGPGFLGALSAFLERGIEIVDPQGEVYTISLSKGRPDRSEPRPPRAPATRAAARGPAHGAGKPKGRKPGRAKGRGRRS